MVCEGNKASSISLPVASSMQSQGHQVGASMACPGGSHGLWATRYKC